MIPKPLASLTEADLDSLVTNKVDERKTLEFKQTLPRDDDKDKTEFRADVTSLANSSGGDLLYGVEAKDGVATAVVGLGAANMDSELLRLQNLLFSHVDPRIPGVEMQAVTTANKGPVLVVRVPKSWRGPHLVKMPQDNRTFRMFGRHDKGKWAFDGTEIRAAYLLSEQLEQRVRRWRDDRLAKVAAREMPVELDTGPLVVLHLMPVSAFNDRNVIAVRNLERHRPAPLVSSGWNHHINLDGFVLYDSSPNSPKGKHHSYTQLFRSGCVEAASVKLFGKSRLPSRHELSRGYETRIADAVDEYTKVLVALGVAYPLVVAMAIFGARGSALESDGRELDRDEVILPDVLIERPDQDVKTILRPLFDAVWNAYGYSRSMNYDDDGKWIERR